MIIERIHGSPFDAIDTHETVYFKKIWRACAKYITAPDLAVIVDPFARNCMLGTHRNDINEDTMAEHHQDALEWLQSLKSGFADMVIFDPPFSAAMAERKYGESGNIYTLPGYVKNCMLEIERILKPGGYLLKFGYNTTRHLPSFVWRYGWVVNSGGNRNDVLVSLWRMNQMRLDVD